MRTGLDLDLSIGAVCTGLVLLIIFVGPFVTHYSAVQTDINSLLLSPSTLHWLGTDNLGRDQFARLAIGGWYSIGAGVLIIAVAVGLGAVVGLVAGYLGGWFDEILMRFSELVMAFPALILAMVIAFAVGPSFLTSVGAMGFAWFPGYARLIRGMVLEVRQQLYVEAARATGASTAHILFRTILPQVVPVVTSRATTNIGMAIIFNAGLSFVGLGVQPPTPDWGAMLASADPYIFEAWWLAAFPGLAILLTVVGFSLLGDWLQGRFDPMLRSTDRSSGTTAVAGDHETMLDNQSQ
jgi:peptide/nickel transport system permease protein